MFTNEPDLDVLLLSTYELGHQPLGLASPAAWLREAGARVRSRDVAIEELGDAEIAAADLVALHVPMHTASRMAVPLAARVRQVNPRAHVCFYGLYAPVNEAYFRELGAATILGGEYEQGLVALYRRLRGAAGHGSGRQVEPVISLARQDFRVPDRVDLPALERYAYLTVGQERRTVGYTEATRGCKHTCRHCPIVPVYGGKFRTVGRAVVLADVRQQVAAGATHITFGDPDFFNAPGHSLPLVAEFHEEFPEVTYDVTIKVEHLLRHAGHLRGLKETGCLFLTSAIESVDDLVLDRLDKRHTREDLASVVSAVHGAGLTLSPTFVAFNPWTSPASYVDFLDTIASLGLVESVSPVQYAIRLLIPAGSRLMDLNEVRDLVEEFDPQALVYPWSHVDPAVDALHRDVMEIATDTAAAAGTEDRVVTFDRIRAVAYACAGLAKPAALAARPRDPGASDLPRLSEPWYCCAEPLPARV
jgi:radical SAM superfamily enzyme YgiQ (UPF0313 family)